MIGVLTCCCHFVGDLQGHDGETLDLSRWVAVASDGGFYIGNITALKSEEITVDFIRKTKDGTYKWPKRKDTDTVSGEYIFFSSPQLQKVGTDAYVLNDEQMIEKKFLSFEKAYLS